MSQVTSAVNSENIPIGPKDTLMAPAESFKEPSKSTCGSYTKKKSVFEESDDVFGEVKNELSEVKISQSNMRDF